MTKSFNGVHVTPMMMARVTVYSTLVFLGAFVLNASRRIFGKEKVMNISPEEWAQERIDGFKWLFETSSIGSFLFTFILIVGAFIMVFIQATFNTIAKIFGQGKVIDFINFERDDYNPERDNPPKENKGNR